MSDSIPAKMIDPELDAMKATYIALKDLPLDSQQRVLDYVMARLGIGKSPSPKDDPGQSYSPKDLVTDEVSPSRGQALVDEDVEDELAGVSPIAQKWIRRNGLAAKQLSFLFSLGLDEIDLVAKSVPGTSKREKMRNVLLLIGVSAYLGSGVARFEDATLRTALTHYNAYDQANFATYLKAFASEVSGSKDSGYILTARGLAGAADLIKEMTLKA